MKKIIKSIRIVLIFIVALLFIVQIVEILSIYNEPNTYQKIYDFSNDSSHWILKSSTNFIKWHVVVALFYMAYFVILFFFLKKQSKNIFYLVNFFDFFLILFLVRYLYLWYLSGFDHYPGFDPFLF